LLHRRETKFDQALIIPALLIEPVVVFSPIGVGIYHSQTTNAPTSAWFKRSLLKKDQIASIVNTKDSTATRAEKFNVIHA
jgi:hypothetical protein